MKLVSNILNCPTRGAQCSLLTTRFHVLLSWSIRSKDLLTNETGDEKKNSNSEYIYEYIQSRNLSQVNTFILKRLEAVPHIADQRGQKQALLSRHLLLGVGHIFVVLCHGERSVLPHFG